MKSRDALRELAEGVSSQDIFDQYRDRYGRHASREMARRYGVTQRTIQRALSGQTRNPKFTRSERFQADMAAEAVRNIHVAHVGTVQVLYQGRDEGPRSIGTVSFDADEDLADVIDALARGAWDEAGDAFDAAVIEQYGDESLADALTIGDYEDGLSFE